MCGIAGIARPGLTPSEGREVVARMCATIVHRGPDGEGFFTDPDVALGMRRLSIIDVSGGWQPIGSEDGRIQVVFNGEIYNHRTLRRELEHAGHVFRTRSDTEAIVHGYEEWNLGVLDRLRGMFAIAIWDRRESRLVLARDRVGIKPLYVWHGGGGLAFASELKAFESLPGFARVVDDTALMKYLALGYVPDPLAIWRGVRKLAPGHLLTWTRDEGAREREWWSPRVAENSTISPEEAVGELRRLLEDAVASHLESEVPLGAFLSGGVDSSAVVAQMARLMDRPVQTFSIGFDDPAVNEAPRAAIVARAIGTDHTERILHADVDVLIDDLVLGFDEPFADSSALPTWLVSKLARERVTVALSGDGGDELFGGYTRYEKVRQSGFRHSTTRNLARAIGRRLPAGVRGRAFLLDLARGAEGRYAGTVALPTLLSEGGVVRRELADEGASLEMLLSDLFSQVAGRDFDTQMMLVDVMSYLPGDILTKVDRMSMRVSLEARVPLLDHHLVEFALALPSHLKFRNGSGKWVFREAIRPLVPAAVLTQPKHGFDPPLGAWLQGPMAHRLSGLTNPDSSLLRFCDREAVSRLVREHMADKRDHSYYLWRLVVLDLWLRAHQL